jgi:cell division protein ZapA (FtsZ GTPase activity inhibitor)
MAALLILDELATAKKELLHLAGDRTEAEEDKLAESIERLASRVEAIAARLEAA